MVVFSNVDSQVPNMQKTHNFIVVPGEVLLVIKQSLNDTNFLLEDWEQDSYMDPCNSWSHVTCVSGDHVATL